MSKTTFLGTGLMGRAMARNLLAAGFSLEVWNRSREKAEMLVRHGATVAKHATDAVRGAETIVLMLSDGPAVADLLFTQGVAEEIGEAATVIDMSSIRPDEARNNAIRLWERGVRYLDAPVSGGTKAAEAATLTIMAGGEASAFEAARPILSAMGRPMLLGPSGSGQLAKLANQAIVAITIGAVAEGLLLVHQGGVDMCLFREALKGGFADSIILQQHGKRMQDGDFAPGGRSVFQLKDLDNVLCEAKTLGLKLPLAQMQRNRFLHLVQDMNYGDLDHAALFLELLETNELAGIGAQNTL